MIEAKYIPLTFVSEKDEKERLIKNTMLLRHFGSLAENEVPLSHYIEGTQYGFNAAAKDSGTNRFVRISDITNGKIDWDSVPFCKCDDPDGYLLNDHDLIIARTGGTTGKSFMVLSPPKDSIFAGYLIRIRANSNTNPAFISIFLNSYFYWGQITSLNRDEFRPSVNAKKLSALKLPKFERSVQDEIVAIASDSENSNIVPEIEEVLTSQKRQVELASEITHQEALLGKLKQAILQEAIQGKLTEQWRAENPATEPAAELLKRIQKEKDQLIADKKIRKQKPLPPITPEEIPFGIPEGWEWCRLMDMSRDIHYGFTASADVNKKETRLLRITDIQNDRVNWESVPGCACTDKERRKYLLNVGDILIARTGGTVGKSYLVDALPVQSVFASYLVRVIPSFIELAVFIKMYLGSPCYWEQLIDAARGAQPNVSGSKLKNLLFPLPPLAEQAAIVERVEALMAHCRELEQEIEHSRQHADRLLQAVLKEAFSPATQLKARAPDEEARIIREALKK
ncbi:Type-1 restriction enzyme EcoKI specificity protein [Pontiella desulfatans]|uniref:Type-1 restriction enzyme EcoKI specificity protein n=1 Tax=Pontiella desulfatans TaxID=2750659 RepID=A0A6C2UDQ7_PONDE|nr:restriction endonuclease subunit S [Pontiella desulfatans]VGO17504.1 Type-1 restriction enzyme EcoKI specificity protein [Pontiella desulfatans]